MFDETNHILKVSSRLDQFKRTSPGVYNFRCPYCGDSSKNKRKARGYIYLKNAEYFYRCHNCNQGANLYNFLLYVDPLEAKEYTLQKFKNSKKFKKVSYGSSKKIGEKEKISSLLKRCSELEDYHPAKKYLTSRKIDILDQIFYTSKPIEFLEKYSDSKILSNSPKIVFPLKNVKGKEFGFVFRDINHLAKFRYQTIIFDDRYTKSYGLEHINKDKLLYVVEGIMDSLSLENSIAALDANLHTTAKSLNFNRNNTILVFDNEPRNKWVCRSMEKAIKDGWGLFIWPKNIQQKDINECKIDGLDMKDTIKSNAFIGQKALLKFNNWKSC